MDVAKQDTVAPRRSGVGRAAPKHDGASAPDREARRAARARNEAAEAALDAVAGPIAALARVEAGLRREDPPAGAGEPPAEPARDGGGEIPLALAEARALLARAGRGEGDPAKLRAALDASPRIWETLGDLGRHATLAWIAAVDAAGSGLREALVRKAEAVEAELLAGGRAGPLESLVARRVVIGMVQVAHADLEAARARQRGAPAAEVERLDRRQERAQQAYFGAMKMLTEVRKSAAAEVAAEKAGAGREAVRKRRPRKGPAAAMPQPLADRLRGLVETSVN